ncbi:hypothetical protein K435DRAFT_1805 [Dendrothele bispora CBS 962.96]|uniref:Transcription factor domain-containing protein n=1 Tax=Dendrothele bispora (strain CBS 962.96) TaxID=1314807 RepID=A0A4S8MY35_DENBC|nr:hypothetical protein K435DRAFT_1805 [Dendrothele bispora CBS 962.96]
MACLALPPNHPRFPSTPVLHAICAVGALFTPAVTSPPPLSFAEMSPEYIFTQRHRQKEDRPVTFAEVQAKFAKETAGKLEYLGMDLLQVLQTNILLSWYYWSHAGYVSSHQCCCKSNYGLLIHSDIDGLRFVNYACQTANLVLDHGISGIAISQLCTFFAFMCSSRSQRMPSVPYYSKSYRPVSVVPAAKSVVEDETRRNAFWFAYAMERQHGCSNAWALSLDDQDVTQLLPVRSDQFEQGVLVPPKERQWAHTPELLLNHTDGQVDPFILYIKACVLLSKVKTFNLRFRGTALCGG